MACGLPIVAFTEGGGTVEMIGAEAGICVPLGGTEAVANSLGRLGADADLRTKLGRRGVAIVREKWRPDDYVAFMADLVSETAGVPVAIMGSRELTPGAGDRRVFVVFDDWQRNAVTAQAEALVEDLNSRGFSAEILLSRGRFADSQTPGLSRHIPRVPYRFLQLQNVAFQGGRWRTSIEEIWKGLQRFCRRMQPCVLITVQDQLSAALAPMLPATVGIVSVLSDGNRAHVEEMYQLAHNVDLSSRPP